MGMLAVLKCSSYIAGIIDVHSAICYVKGTQLFCLPKEDISGDQAVRVFIKWVNKNPAQFH